MPAPIQPDSERATPRPERGQIARADHDEQGRRVDWRADDDEQDRDVDWRADPRGPGGPA